MTVSLWFCRFTHKVETDLISDYRPQISRQEKKDLHTKLDDILLGGLHGDFEFCPGHAVDRLEMVQFLTSVVHRHLQDFPELQQILDLRDTVLTSRVKRAFPGVEYKRKQVKEDNGKKVYPWKIGSLYEQHWRWERHKIGIIINDFNKASKVAQQTLFMMTAILDLL